MVDDMRRAPAYAVSSVDSALRLAVVLQLEGPLTVSQAAARLGVARSTAHRLLRMLCYRDFAVQGGDRAYRAGPVLELAAHPASEVVRLREAALPRMRHLVDLLDETVNLTVRTGATARFVASVECARPLRVGDREGMVFPAHLLSGGLVLLAELDAGDLATVLATAPAPAPDPQTLAAELAGIRRQGFAVNDGRSERGVVAVGRLVRRPDGTPLAALSVSLPSVRYEAVALPGYVAALGSAVAGIEAGLRQAAR